MISINEIFHSVQGEGPTIGKPSIFLRLSGCNLECVWCDTKYTWLFSQDKLDRLLDTIPSVYHHQLGDIVYSKEDEITKLSENELEERLRAFDCNHIVITGGEPLLQQKQLIPLIEKLHVMGYSFEMETNGTIKPLTPDYIQYNVSPKLSNSFNQSSKRYLPDVIDYFNKINAFFKFVISSSDDLEEVEEIIKTHSIPNESVYLMPEGISSKELNSRGRELIEICKAKNYNYSHRLHIQLYEDERGK
jgi:organic radical activating enzyme